jgi:hypothetical protein
MKYGVLKERFLSRGNRQGSGVSSYSANPTRRAQNIRAIEDSMDNEPESYESNRIGLPEFGHWKRRWHYPHELTKILVRTYDNYEDFCVQLRKLQPHTALSETAYESYRAEYLGRIKKKWDGHWRELCDYWLCLTTAERKAKIDRIQKKIDEQNYYSYGHRTFHGSVEPITAYDPVKKVFCFQVRPQYVDLFPLWKDAGEATGFLATAGARRGLKRSIEMLRELDTIELPNSKIFRIKKRYVTSQEDLAVIREMTA